MRNIAKYRLPVTLGVAAPLLFLFAQTAGLDAGLTGHETKLLTANSLTAKFTVQTLPGGPVEHTLTYSKPNLLRIDSPEGFTLTDGKMLWVYDKAKNTYTESPVDEKTISINASQDIVLAWSSFFNKDALKDAKGVKAGAKRNIKGNLVTEYSFLAMEGKQTVTLYVDSKLGVARGAAVKLGDQEILVLASEISIGETALDASKFAFTPPAGSTKLERTTSDVTYAQVAPIINLKCAGCHSATMRAGGFDFSTYLGIKGSGRAAMAGNSRASSMVRSMRSGRMPQGGPRLPDSEIDLIAAWIDGGMKE